MYMQILQVHRTILGQDLKEGRVVPTPPRASARVKVHPIRAVNALGLSVQFKSSKIYFVLLIYFQKQLD